MPLPIQRRLENAIYFEKMKADNSNEPRTALYKSVKVGEQLPKEASYISIQSYKIVVERQDKLYRVVSVLENILTIGATLFMISICIGSVAYAIDIINT